MPTIEFLVPFGLTKPYRTNSKLEDKIQYLFQHPRFIHRTLYNNVSTSGSKALLNDMCCVAVSMCSEYLDNPQQYGHTISNIEWQIIIRMWKQTFRHTKLQSIDLNQWYGTKEYLLSIDNQWVEELIRTVKDKDYIQHNDDMVKVRDGVGLRDRRSYGTHEGSKQFEYLCSLE